MQIFVRSIRGVVLVLNVSDDETVESLKLKVFEKNGIKPKDQILMFDRKRLENDHCLSEYGLQENSDVILATIAIELSST